MSVRSAAEILGLRQSTIRAWLLSRRLPHVKLGRAVRIPLGVIEDLIKDGTVPARRRIARVKGDD